MTKRDTPLPSDDVRRFRLREKLLRYARAQGVFIALLVVVVAVTALKPVFLSPRNLINILRQASIMGVMAVGSTFVILTAGIDLSVGSTMAIAGLASATYAVNDPTPMNIALAFLLPLVVGTVVGIANGIGVGVLRVPAFVVTLGTLTSIRGLAYLYTNSQPIVGIQPWFTVLGEGSILSIPVPVVVFLTFASLGAAVLRFTRFGLYVYAVGGNPTSARLSGLPVRGILISVYAISGLSAALAAMILNGRLHVAQSVAGLGVELTVITAVVIGGTSLFGGRGSVGGSVLGVLLLSVILNGLNLLNISSFIQQIVVGLVLVVSVWLDDRMRPRSLQPA